MLLTIVSENIEVNNQNDKVEDSRGKFDNNQYFIKKMNIPSEINDIQPRVTQVWNFDEVGIDPNGKCDRVVCTYKFFPGEIMRKVKTGEQATLWCTLLVFTRDDGK